VGKRTKLILAIVIGAIILFSGALFGLAKYGVINLKMLADTIGVKSTSSSLTVTVSYATGAQGNQTIKLYRKTADSISLGTTEVDSRSITAPGNVSFSLASGYVYDVACVNNAVPNLNIHPSSLPVSASVICGIGAGGGGGQSCDPNNQNSCPEPLVCGLNSHACQARACTGTGQSTCPSGQICQNQFCQVATFPTTNILTGKVFNSRNELLSNVSVQIYDTATQQNISQAMISDESGDSYGNNYSNYESGAFVRENLNNLVAKFSYPGYNDITLNLTTSGSIIRVVAGASGEITSFLKDIKFENLAYTSTLDIIGKIQFGTGAAVPNINLSAKCSNGITACTSKPNMTKTAVSELAVTNRYGWNTNYQISDFYNIAKPAAEFNSFTLEYIVPSGFYYDTNNNGVLDGPHETGTIQLTINANQVTTPTVGFAKSSVHFDIVVKTIETFTLVVNAYSTDINNPEIPYANLALELKRSNSIVNAKTTSTTKIWPQTADQKIGNAYFDNLDLYSDIHLYTLEATLTEAQKQAGANLGSQNVFSISSSMIETYNNSKIVRISIPIFLRNTATFKILNQEADQPINNASVEVFDLGCPTLGKFTQSTNSDGISVFSDPTLINYLNGNIPSCLPALQYKITKNGFSTQIGFTIGRALASVQIIRLSALNTSTPNGIFGKVFDFNNQNPISGAKVSIYNNSRPDKSMATTTTDQNGYYQFTNLATGRYILSTTLSPFLHISASRALISYTQNTKINTNLFLKPPNESTIVSVTCVNKYTIQPLPYSVITITGIGNNYLTEKVTDGYGGILYDLPVGSTYQLTCKARNVSGFYSYGSTTAIIPIDLSSISHQEFQKQFIITVDTGVPNRIDKLSVNVYNNSGLVSDAKIQLIANTSLTQYVADCQDVNLYYGKGKAPIVIPDDKVNSPIEDKFICGLEKRYFSSGELVTIKVVDQNQTFSQIIYPKYGSQNEAEINIYLKDKDSIGIDEICVENNDWNTKSSINQAYTFFQKLVLHRWNNGQWITENAPSYYIKETEIDGIDSYYTNCYKNQSAGKYRVKYVGDVNISAIISDEVEHQAGNSDWVEIDTDNEICKNSGNKFYITSFSPGITWAVNDENYFNSNRQLFLDLNATLVSVMQSSKKIDPVLITIFPHNDATAYASYDVSSCMGVSNPAQITFSREFIDQYKAYNREDILRGTIAHEYAHQFYHILLNDHDKIIWNNLYNEILKSTYSDAVWASLRESNIVMENTYNLGHPWDNANEMFASFFSAYFTQHDNFYGIINYHLETMQPPQNITAFMWQFFSEKIGKVYTNDNKFFTPVGGQISGANYTFDQIANGNWRQTGYENLNVTAKAKVLYSRNVAPILNQGKAIVSRAIISVNNAVDRILSSLGLTVNTGTVSGKVVNLKGKVIGNIIVQIGPKYAITASDGSFTIANVPEGQQNIEQISSFTANIGTAPMQQGYVQVTRRQTTTVTIRANK